MTTVTRPVLRYHGGKWRLAPWIISHFPVHRVYVEPFGGAASVLLRKQRSFSEVYNDLDGEVVNLFRVLRNPSQARELGRLVRLTPCAREEFDNAKLPHGDPIEQARRTLVQYWFAFATGRKVKSNKTFRSHASVRRSVAHDWASFGDAIEQIAERWSGVLVENAPAVEVIERFDAPECLLYCDPPYVLSTRAARQAGNIYSFEMTDEEHRELAAVLRKAKGMVVLSGYQCELYDELYGDWRRLDQNTIADGGAARVESLWLSPRVAAQGHLFE